MREDRRSSLSPLTKNRSWGKQKQKIATKPSSLLFLIVLFNLNVMDEE
jgi:hypothetical protein